MKYWLAGLALLGCLVLTQFGLRSQNNAAAVAAPDTVVLRLAFGAQDKQPAKWDGAVQASGARIAKVEGWRFMSSDSIQGQAWKTATEEARPGSEPVFGPVMEKGVIVTAEGASPETRFDVDTANGKFSFTTAQIPFGATLATLNGRVRVERLPSTMAITTSSEDEDCPAIVSAGDSAYVAYVEFAHSDRAKESFATMTSAPANFDWLSRPAGGDRVKLMTWSKSTRQWSAAEDVSPAKEDIMRAAVAVDSRKRVWVIWSARRNGNFDLFARFRDGARWSPEVRLTSNAGNDVNPVAATDSNGRVWVAWQAYRGNNLEILAAAQNGDRFTPEQKVSFSPASDWDPAIAAGPKGEVAVTWDTYDKGDYDVYARVMRYGKAIEMEKPVAVAASGNFEARSAAAYDRQGRLWVAFESADQRWGKDFGVYDVKGISLYLGHNLRVRVLEGNRAFETDGSLADALRSVPGLTSREMAGSGAANPGMKNGTKIGPRNTFPRMAADEQGRIYLTFRSSAGIRSQIGNTWNQYLTWYEGAQWVRPVEVPHSEGLNDMRAALAAVAPGHLLLAMITDHRKTFQGAQTEEDSGPAPGQINTDIVSAEMRIAKAAVEAKLTAAQMETPAAPADDIKAELAQVATLRAARTTLGGQQLSLMRGEFHRHTEYSTDGGADGPLIDAYRYLVDAAHMDWGGCCDHDNGNGREYAWWLQQQLTDAYFMPGSYIPMFSYERSVRYPEGHRNTIFVQRGIRPLPRLPKTAENSPQEPAPDTQMLYRYLRQYRGIVASHTSATQMGTDWRDNDPLLEPVVEIYQGERQNYEMPGAPRTIEESRAIGGWRPLGFVSLALKKGYRLGFESSSDHISTHISYCNLWVTNRTREGVIEAFRKRRIYGATDNILADVRCAGHFMGEEFTLTAAPVISVHLVGTAEFAKVQIIRDGEAVYATAPQKRDASFEWRETMAADGATHYYYVRGEQKDGQLVWVSPMWIKR